MEKIARKFMAHYMDVGDPESGEEHFERLGEGLEEFSVQMSAQIDKKRNILGETDIIISGYDKTAEVATYYANPQMLLYSRLMDIIENDRVHEYLSARLVDVHLWKKPTGFQYPAVLEHVYIEVKSYGGDATGLQIPFTIHYTGKRELGSFDLDNCTFIPTEETP